MIKLFVSGFPLDITEIELAKLIAPHGDIATQKIVRDKKTRICKGFAFVEMETNEGAEQACEALNGTPMQDRELTVKISEDKPVMAPQPKRFNYTPRTNQSNIRSNINQTSERPKRPRKHI
jgi:RNA recognition motif-containing protein